MNLREVHSSVKDISVPLSWVERDDGRLEVVAPLEIDSVTIEGLLFRATAIRDLPDCAVMMQVEYEQARRRDWALDRIDWLPLHAHRNPNRGPEHLRLVDLRGSHHHRFDLNWNEAEDRMIGRNLPLAAPLARRCDGIEAAIALAAAEFRIPKLRSLASPPWQRRLL